MNNSEDKADALDDTEQAVDLATKTDKLVGNPISLLLGPSAKVVGEHWAKKLSAKLSKREVQNIHEKVDAAQVSKDRFENLTPRQFGALVEWMESAKASSQSDHPDLHMAWVIALQEILNENYVFLDALTDLSEDELTFFKSGGPAPLPIAKKLEVRGLIYNTSQEQYQMLVPYMVTGGGFLLVLGFMAFADGVPSPLTMTLLAICYAVSGGSFALHISNSVKVKLTPSGTKILKKLGVETAPQYKVLK